MPPAPGTKLGPYEIVAPLGAGGMGEVYRAIDRKLDRQVAVKVLPAGMAAGRERLARFEREAQVLATFNDVDLERICGIGGGPSGDETGGGEHACRATSGDKGIGLRAPEC